jgi:hypothetical protein
MRYDICSRPPIAWVASGCCSPMTSSPA